MNKIRTKTEQTPTGEIEYDAVDCFHCEFEVPVENCTHAYFPRNVSNCRSYSKYKIELGSDGDQRIFCEDCTEQLFGDVNGFNYQRRLWKFCEKEFWKFVVIFAAHIVGIVLAFIGSVELLLAIV